jgi:hypothetical protein
MAWRSGEKPAGHWRIENNGRNGLVYRLYNVNGNPLLSLLKVDKSILLFTDNKGNPLCGNEDFSFTLIRTK